MILALALTEAELTELGSAHLRSLGIDEGCAGELAPGRDLHARTQAAVEARRALVARGLLTPTGCLLDGHGGPGAGAADAGVPEGQDSADADGSWDEAAQIIRAVLDIRAAATRTLVVDRLVATSDQGHVQHDVRLVHLLDDVACVEDLTDGGACYLWLLLGPEEVAAAVAGVVVPEDAAPGSGPVRPAPVDRPEVMGELLDRPTVLATLSVLDAEAEPVDEHLLALGPRGCWLARRTPGAPGPQLVFRAVEPGWVLDRVRDLIGTPPPTTRPGGETP